MKFTTGILVLAVAVAAVQALPVETEADITWESVPVQIEADISWESAPLKPAKDEQSWKKADTN